MYQTSEKKLKRQVNDVVVALQLEDETKPTVKELDDKLSNLVDWERFALHLPQITQTDINTIKQDNPMSTVSQKQALFNKWLKLYPTASWEHVIVALETVGENNIAQTILQCLPDAALLPKRQLTPHEEIIQESTLLTLSELHRSFAELSFECEGELMERVQNSEVTLSSFVKRVKAERAYTFEDLDGIKDVNQFFIVISEHYHFLNTHLLVVLAKQFLNPSIILHKLLAHVEKIEAFKRQPEIRSLYKTLQPFVSKSSNEAPVTIGVENAWEHTEIWLVETLLQTLFRLKKNEIPKWFRVIPGSSTTVFSVPQHKIPLLTSDPGVVSEGEQPEPPSQIRRSDNDPGVVTEGEHSEPPSQKRKSDNERISDDILRKAISEGSGYLKPSVVIMHGPPGAGKSSVKDLILGRPPRKPEEQNSTGIMERPIRTCRVVKGNEHEYMLKEVDRVEFHHMLLSTVRAECSQSKHTKKGQDIPATVGSLMGISTVSPIVHHPASHPTNHVTISPSPKPLPHIDSSQTLKTIQKRLATAKSSNDLFNLDWIHFVDSGGQPQFTDVLPLLFRSEALYIVVVRLDQNFNEIQKNFRCEKGKLIALPDHLSLTSKELVERTCQIAEAQSTKDLPKKVIVIGTRLDKVDPNVVKQFDTELKILHSKYESVLVPSDIKSGEIIFALNAMAEGSEREAYTKELQECLLKIVEEAIKPVKVPLKWFVYELDLDEASKESSGVVTKAKCVEVGKGLGMTPQEIEGSLEFFNKLALHLYHSNEANFPELVLVRIDPLVDRLSALIRISFDYPKHNITKEFSKLRQCGLFVKSFLSTVFKLINNKAISEDDFLKILECLKVIVHVEQNEYFIPSVLSVHDNEEIEQPVYQYAFNWGERVLPPGFFFTFIVLLPKEYFTFPTSETVSQSRHKIILGIRKLGGTVTLYNNHKWIGLYYSGYNHAHHRKILCIVYQTLKDVVERFSNLTGIKFPELCFICPCSDAKDHPCYVTEDGNDYICSTTFQSSPLLDEMKSISECWKSLSVPQEGMSDIIIQTPLYKEKSASEKLGSGGEVELSISRKRQHDLGVVSEGEHIEPPSQIRRSDNETTIHKDLNRKEEIRLKSDRKREHDSDVVSEGEHSEPPSQKRKSDNVSPSNIVREYTPKLLDAIGDPNKLAVAMWSKYLLTVHFYNSLQTTQGLSQFQKAQMIMTEFYRAVSAGNGSELLKTFCTVLKEQEDPILSNIADEILEKLT